MDGRCTRPGLCRAGPLRRARGGTLCAAREILPYLAQVWAGDGTRALRRQEGQTMAEYGVVLAVITLTCIAAFTLLSDRVRTALTNVAGVLPG